MPKNGQTTLLGYPDEPPRRPRKRCMRRFQDQLHAAEQKEREAWRQRRRTPSRRSLRHAAMIQLMIEESAEAARR